MRRAVRLHGHGAEHGKKNKLDPVNYDDADYRPDIAVGRWPFSTPAESRLVAAKTMSCERSAPAGSDSGPRRAAFFAVGGWVESRELMERLAQGLTNAGWYPPSIFFQGMKFMLFGDPSLRLPGHEP